MKIKSAKNILLIFLYPYAQIHYIAETQNSQTMKKMILPLLAAVLLTAACEDLMQTFGRQGELQIRFSETTIPGTRASALPDTNEFIISITDGKGNSVYEGRYGALKEKINLGEGNYTVVAKSCEFSTPLFDTPQFGDTQVAAVKSGKTTVVTLSCVQINSGIRLQIDSGFLTAYPDAVLYLKSSTGKLMYGYTEKRIAYFLPGTVSLIMAEGTAEQNLFSKLLEAQQVLTLNIGVGSQNAAGRNNVTVQLDTTRNWINETYIIGEKKEGGNDNTDAYSVNDAKQHIGEEDIWVYGYIVGGDLSSKSCSFKAPFSSRTNLVIASKSSCTDKASCMSVQLPKGNVRDELNLVDNEGYLGKQIFLKGDVVESYYGIPGLQNISEYNFK